MTSLTTVVIGLKSGTWQVEPRLAIVNTLVVLLLLRGVRCWVTAGELGEEVNYIRGLRIWLMPVSASLRRLCPWKKFQKMAGVISKVGIEQIYGISEYKIFVGWVPSGSSPVMSKRMNTLCAAAPLLSTRLVQAQRVGHCVAWWIQQNRPDMCRVPFAFPGEIIATGIVLAAYDRDFVGPFLDQYTPEKNRTIKDQREAIQGALALVYWLSSTSDWDTVPSISMETLAQAWEQVQDMPVTREDYKDRIDIAAPRLIQVLRRAFDSVIRD